MNASEPLMRLRYAESSERWITKTMMLGAKWKERSALPERSTAQIPVDEDTRPPRSKEGTHPSRISLMWNVETPMRSGSRPVSGPQTPVSQPQGKPNSLAGRGGTKKRKSPAVRQGETITRRIGPSKKMEIPKSKDGRRGSGTSPKERCNDYLSKEKLDARSHLSKRNGEASCDFLERHRLAPAGAACS